MSDANTPTTGTDEKVSAAKAEFKRLLLQHDGETSHPEVKAAMDHLIGFIRKGDGAEEWAPAYDKALNSGAWKTLTSPPFPGRLPANDDDDDGKTAKYTLGRMSFGMFKPTNSVCTVTNIVNLVEPLPPKDVGITASNDEAKPDAEKSAWEQSYTFKVPMNIIVPMEGSTVKLPAKLVNFGVCTPQSGTRLGVKFTGGTLQPDFDLSKEENDSLTSTWTAIFENAISKEKSQQTYLGAAKSYMQNALMTWMMGLEPPLDVKELTQTYTIKKPFMGYLDILYIDDDFRITKGNRGTIVVVERM